MTTEEVLSKLKDIAKEQNLELEDIKVLYEYQNRYGGLYGKVADDIFSIYTKNRTSIYGVRIYDNGIVTHVKKVPSGEYEPVLFSDSKFLN